MAGQGISRFIALLTLTFVAVEAGCGPKVAVMSFHDDGVPAGLQQTYAGFTSLVQVHLEEAGLELVEREQMDGALQELELSQLLSPTANRLAQGRWARAELLVEGVWREQRKLLGLQVVDLSRGTVLETETERFDGGVELEDLDTDFAQRVSARIRSMISNAIKIRDEIGGKLIIAPLLLQTAEAKGLGVKYIVPLLSAGEHFAEAMERASDSGRHHVLRFEGADAARSEAELKLMGLVDDNPDSWQSLAHVYVWGNVTTTPSNYVIRVKVWNRGDEPVLLKRTVSNGIPKEFQEAPRDPTTGSVYSWKSPEFKRYAEGRKKFLTFPTNEVFSTLDRLAADAVAVATDLRSVAVPKSLGRQLTEEFLRPYLTMEKMQIEFAKKRGTYSPVMAALGLGRHVAAYPPEMSIHMVRAAEVASFFDPADQAVREELMIALDVLEHENLSAPEFDFRSSLRWGKHVDRFGLQTVNGTNTTLRSGGKLEPYFGRWFNTWVQLREAAGRGVPPMKNSNSFYRPLSPLTPLPQWMLEPGILDLVEVEASKRLFTCLQYLAKGHLALGSLKALPYALRRQQRELHPNITVPLLRAAVLPPNGLVPPERRAEAEELLRTAIVESYKSYDHLIDSFTSTNSRYVASMRRRFATWDAAVAGAARREKEAKRIAASRPPLPKSIDSIAGVWGGRWVNQWPFFFQFENVSSSAAGTTATLRYRVSDYFGGVKSGEILQVRSVGNDVLSGYRTTIGQTHKPVISFKLDGVTGLAVLHGQQPIGTSLVRINVADLNQALEADLEHMGWRSNPHPSEQVRKQILGVGGQ